MIPAGFAQSYPTLLRQILWSRGFRDEVAVEKYLKPSLSDIPKPFDTLLDLEIALEHLLKAREKQALVVIFGDYDVDGTTSSAVLIKSMRDMGWLVESYIPHRVNEGYGVTKVAAEKMLERYPRAAVVVTCDCGIASFEGIATLKSRGLSVIVTDHHEVPRERVSADAVINPKQLLCRYPEKKLAGVGVAFLLVMALRRAVNANDYSLSQFLDLVAIGTVCDVADLSGLNRIFVKWGLKRLRTTSHLGLQILLRQQGLADGEIGVRDLGFMIGPRLNASGRIGEPDLGLRFLLTSNESEALQLVSELETKNRERRSLQDLQVDWGMTEGKKSLLERPESRSLVLMNPQFHLGIVGLIAGRLCQEFQRPICALTEMTDEHALADYFEMADTQKKSLWKGSLRAPVGIHLADTLQEIQRRKPGILVSGGGHAAAAGVTVRDADRYVFAQLFEEIVAEAKVKKAELQYDAILAHPEIDPQVLRLLEPCGIGNPKPLLLMKSMHFSRLQVMKDIHMKLHGTLLGRPCSVLQFRSPWLKMLSKWSQEKNLELDLLVEPMENQFQGITRVEFELKEIVGLRIHGSTVEIKSATNAIGSSQGAREANDHSYSSPT